MESKVIPLICHNCAKIHVKIGVLVLNAIEPRRLPVAL